MRTLRFASIILSALFATVAAAADFDGSVPLACTVSQALDCLPTKASCDSDKSSTNTNKVLTIDFANKQISVPNRKAPLSTLHTTTNTDSLVLQGADLLFAWSALIDRKTGALTVALADSAGAFVYFGTCKAVPKK